MEKKYECIYIINSSLEENIINEVSKKFEVFIKENSKEISINIWGKKKLPYEIKKQLEGFFILLTFKSSPDFIIKLGNRLNLDEKILKYLITLVEIKKIKKSKLNLNRKKSDFKKDIKNNNHTFGKNIISSNEEKKEKIFKKNNIEEIKTNRKI